MAIIKVKYSKADTVVDNIKSLATSVESELSNYERLIRTIANYPEWRGLEKGRILSNAAGVYYNYFNSVKENINDYANQINNKVEDFKEAEK